MPNIKLDLTEIFNRAIDEQGLVIGITIVVCFFVFTFIFILVSLYFYNNPIKLQKTISAISQWFLWLGVGIKKTYIKFDTESRLNDFIKKVGPLVYGYNEVGIRLKWAEVGEDEESFFDKEQLVVVMRDTGVQNKNFVRASMTVISKTILPKTRRYLSKSQCESVEIFIAKKLFESEKPQAMDYFFEEFFNKKTSESDKIAQLIEKYNLMDKAGIFFPVYMQELNFLGEKVFWQKRTSEIWEEVNRLSEFLKNYTNRVMGTETTPLVYEGRFCRCGIVIIGRSMNVSTGNIRIYNNYIRRLRDKKIETFYLMGADSDQGKAFVESVIESLEDLGIEKYRAHSFTAKIKTQDDYITFPAYLCILRSTDIERYYDQQYQTTLIEQGENVELETEPDNE